MPPRPKEPKYAGGKWPPLYRTAGPNIPCNQLGVPMVTQLNVEGFCRNHLPDPKCKGGPQVWNDLAQLWE